VIEQNSANIFGLLIELLSTTFALISILVISTFYLLEDRIKKSKALHFPLHPFQSLPAYFDQVANHMAHSRRVWCMTMDVMMAELDDSKTESINSQNFFSNPKGWFMR
jgi:hypothetical protein